MRKRFFRLASPFPLFNFKTRTIDDGGQFSCSDFCRKKLEEADRKCVAFYKGLERPNDGIEHHICPYKFSAITVSEGGLAYIITSLFCSDVNSEYKRRHKNTGKIHNITFFKNIEVWLNKFIQEVIPILTEHTKEIFREAAGPFHDLAKINQNIKVTSQDVLTRLDRETLSSYDIGQVKNKVETIYHATEFFTHQKLIVDAFKAGLENLAATPRSTAIHKPFYKTAKIFESLANQKGIRIELGETNAKVRVSTKYFELIPFLLIDNAVKFSSCENNKQVIVDFEEVGEFVYVHVASYGNKIDEEEQVRIFDLHYRGEKEQEREGDGIGLYLLKTLCDTNQTKVSVVSQVYTDKDGCEKAKNVFTLKMGKG